MGFKSADRGDGSRDVDAWLARRAHPLESAMRRIREIVLGTDPRIRECIKWSCPTFTFGGNLASINPHAKHHVSLLVHRGAHIPGDHPLLEGGGDTARYIRFADGADVEAKRAGLEAVVRAWCDWRAT